MIRTKGEAGTGNVVEAVRHMRAIVRGMRTLAALGEEELMAEAKRLGAPYEQVRQVARTGKLPVPNFSAGGVATPADAALMMLLGAEAVFVGSGIFKAAAELPPEKQIQEQERRARAIVQAVANYNHPEILLQVSEGLGIPMKGLDVREIPEEQLLAKRGW